MELFSNSFSNFSMSNKIVLCIENMVIISQVNYVRDIISGELVGRLSIFGNENSHVNCYFIYAF